MTVLSYLGHKLGRKLWKQCWINLYILQTMTLESMGFRWLVPVLTTADWEQPGLVFLPFPVSVLSPWLLFPCQQPEKQSIRLQDGFCHLTQLFQPPWALKRSIIIATETVNLSSIQKFYAKYCEYVSMHFSMKKVRNFYHCLSKGFMTSKRLRMIFL